MSILEIVVIGFIVITTVLSILSTEGRRAIGATLIVSGVVVLPFYPMAAMCIAFTGALYFAPDCVEWL